MTENEQSMYTGMCMCRNNEVNLRWSRSQMFVFIHAAAFSFVGLRPASPGIFIAMGAIGIILGVIWIVINEKSEEWINYWQAKLRKLDQEVTKGDVTMFDGPEWEFTNRRFTFHQILNTFAIFLMLLWFAVFVYGFTLLK